MTWSHSEGPGSVLDGLDSGAVHSVTTANALDSHSIYRDVWSSLAASSRDGEVFEQNGLLIATAGSKWSVMNTVFLLRPVETEADLRDRISFAKDYFEAKKRSWLFILFNEWVDASIRPEQLFWDHRVAYMHGCFGMQATRLLEPARPAPELVYRLVENDAEKLEFSDINADSYGLSEEWRSDIAAWMSQWPESRIRLYIAYSGDKAVSSAMVHLKGDAAFLGFLATRQAHQGRGYGEAIARYALARAQDDWHFSKTMLHSNPAGLSLYRRLGYSEVASFGIYLGGCQ